MLKIISFIFLTIILGLLFTGAIGIAAIIHYSKDLPDYKQLVEYSPPIVTRLHTGNGSLLAEFSSEKRVFVPITSMPKLVINAFVAAEDKNFYQHSGLDVKGIIRASLINIKNFFTDKRLVGASTITQQVAKNFLLTNEVSFNRKIKEALLALRIERIMNKNRILELYLNEIFLGIRSYGIAAAALNYFNKSLGELTISEVAYLAGLPKGPNNYHPVRNKKAALLRRDYVLKRMLSEKMITSTERNQASISPIKINIKTKKDSIYAPYFIEEVRRKVIDMYGEKSLYEGGLSVITTINPKLQNFAINALREGLEDYDKRHGWRGPITNILDYKNNKVVSKKIKQYSSIAGLNNRKIAIIKNIGKDYIKIKLSGKNNIGYISFSEKYWKHKWVLNEKDSNYNNLNKLFKKGDIILVSDEVFMQGNKSYYKLDQIPSVNGAIVAMDPRNGRILALSGGYDFDGSEFNRATQAKRQPGSAFKPFVYTVALENGYNPASKILDAPLVIDQGPGLEKWKPKNYTGIFYGPSTLRVGLEKSRNVMTVRLANKLGMEKVVEMAKRFKIGNLPPLLATSLGSEETTLIDLVAAYSVFVSGGRYNSPALIEKIQDRSGTTVFRRDKRICASCGISKSTKLVMPLLKPEGKQIINSSYAFQITWMLQGVVKRGTARKLNYFKHSLAGKTGTTNDNMDAWFLGFSPDLVVGVFVGFDTPKSLGNKETGGKVAAPIFAKFMDKSLKNREIRPFNVPENIEMIIIDKNTGIKSDFDNKDAIYEAFISGTNSSNNNNIIEGFESDLY